MTHNKSEIYPLSVNREGYTLLQGYVDGFKYQYWVRDFCVMAIEGTSNYCVGAYLSSGTFRLLATFETKETANASLTELCNGINKAYNAAFSSAVTSIVPNTHNTGEE